MPPCLSLTKYHCCEKTEKEDEEKKAKRIMVLCLKKILHVGFEAVVTRHCGRIEFASRNREQSPTLTSPPLENDQCFTSHG